MTSRHTQLDLLAMALLVVLCASWGLQQVAIKVANAGISPVLQAGLRSAGAAVLVWAWAAARGIRLFRRDGTLLPGVAAGLLFAVEFGFVYGGLRFAPASRAILFLYAAPFVVAVGAHFFIPGETLRRIHVLGLACAFLGMAAALEDSIRLPSGQELLGDGMELVAALLWGATTVVVKASRLNRVSPAKVLLYQLAISGVTLPLLSLALDEPGITRLTPLIVACFAYQTVLVAFVTYLLWFWLIAHYPASKLSSFAFLTPLFGIVAGGALLAEPITGGLAAAMALVAVGIYLVNRRQAAAAGG